MNQHACLIAVALLASTCLPALAENNPDSCQPHDWFQLQERAAKGKVSLLCKGVVDSSFEKRDVAERELNAVIRKMPRSASSSDALEALANMYFREGRYRKALAQLDRTLAEKPDAEDVKAMHSLFSVLAQSPDLVVVSSQAATMHSETIEDNLFLPVTANGVAGTYIADTGANISLLCESEARRLGLKVRETTSKVADISGTPSGVRVTEIPDLWIGKTHLKHVAFVVFPDTNEPFVDLPEGHRAVLGIPVLIALGVFRIDKDNRVDIQAGSPSSQGKVIPLAFDGAIPVTQLRLNGKTLSVAFDTGASHTYLYAAFAKAFPDLMRTGNKQAHTLRGVSGSTTQESISLPSVRFSFGKDTQLAPATVLLQSTTDTSKWAAGNLGFDLVQQVLPITVDFHAMQVSVEDNLQR